MTISCDGDRRDLAIAHGLRRGLLLRLPGVLAHLVVVAAAAGMAGVDGCEHFCGGRSSGTLGHGVLVHGRMSCGLLRSPADSLSTGVGSNASWVRSSYGGAMDGGAERSAPVADAVRERSRLRVMRETVQRLTAVLLVLLARQGRHGVRRNDDGDLWQPRSETAALARLQGVRRCVAQRGGRGRRGEAYETGGGAREGWWLRL